MKYTLKIYKNKELINTITNEDEIAAQNELIRILFNKIEKLYKIKIYKDNIKEIVKAEKEINFDDKTIYKYEFTFENVKQNIMY